MSARLALVCLGLSLLLAAPAQGGVTRGSVGAANSLSTCPTDTTVVQVTGGNHVLPAGIVTKWSTRGAAASGQSMRIVILRGSTDPYTVVGQSSMESITPSAVNHFTTRIPVAAGDRLAVTASGGPCMHSTSDFNDTVRSCGAGCNNGATVTTTDLESDPRRVNVSAYIEQDTDGDGWGDESQDNCYPLSNPSQANADGDGSGDDCDVDDDNDSVVDSDDAFPLDERESRDLDGDGLGDSADPDDDNDGASDVDEARAGSDPRNPQSLPAPGFIGATPAAAAVPVEGSVPTLAVEAPASIRRKRLRRGVPASATTDAPAELDFELRATPRGARLARFELLLATRSLGVGTGQRSVRLRPGRLPKDARRFTLQLRVVATDAGGNRAVGTRTIRVR